MADRQFYYIADPMCSWCWGFAPTIQQVIEQYGHEVPVNAIMGGLRAGNNEILDQKGKDYIREHWDHVMAASRQPFDFSFFDRDDFVYNTEPACRAIVTMRRRAPEHSMAYLERVQRAFYAEGMDVTKGEVLIELATEFDQDSKSFGEEFELGLTKIETQNDFAVTQQARVPGFPALVAVASDGVLSPITQGAQPWDVIDKAIHSWLLADSVEH